MINTKYYDKDKLFELTDNERFFLGGLGIVDSDDVFTYTKNDRAHGFGYTAILPFIGVELKKDLKLHDEPLICYTYKEGDIEVDIYRPTDPSKKRCTSYISAKIDGVEYSMASGIHLEYSGPDEKHMLPYKDNEGMIKNNIEWCSMMVSHGNDYVKAYSSPNIVYGEFLQLGVIVNKNGVKTREDIECRLSGITRRKKGEEPEKYLFSTDHCYDLLCGAVNDMCRDDIETRDFLHRVGSIFIDSILSSIKIPLFFQDYRKTNQEFREKYYGIEREYLDEELRVLDLLEEEYVNKGRFIKDTPEIRRKR